MSKTKEDKGSNWEEKSQPVIRLRKIQRIFFFFFLTRGIVSKQLEWVKGEGWGRTRTWRGNVQIFAPLLYQYNPSGKTSEAEWQTNCCLLHTAEMFYQPLRPCQSMVSMFQNIFNTQREQFGFRKWLVPEIDRGLSGCVIQKKVLCFTPATKSLSLYVI